MSLISGIHLPGRLPDGRCHLPWPPWKARPFSSSTLYNVCSLTHPPVGRLTRSLHAYGSNSSGDTGTSFGTPPWAGRRSIHIPRHRSRCARRTSRGLHVSPTARQAVGSGTRSLPPLCPLWQTDVAAVLAGVQASVGPGANVDVVSAPAVDVARLAVVVDDEPRPADGREPSSTERADNGGEIYADADDKDLGGRAVGVKHPLRQLVRGELAEGVERDDAGVSAHLRGHVRGIPNRPGRERSK